MDNSKKLVVHGIFWSAVQIVVNQSFSFIIRLVLAKLLFPEQFGIVGMATVFAGFVQVFNDLGIGAALVQKKDEQLSPVHFHTAFWSGVIWSVCLYLVISFVIGPLAASFYHQPILKNLIPVLSLGVLSSPINLVHKAQLTKQMNFKKIAVIDNTSNIFSGIVALILAFAGAGVWSLAFNAVASIVIAIPMYFKATGWVPEFKWDKLAFKDIFGFGVYTSATNVSNYLINNIDYLLIGKLLSAQALGVYTFAFVLTDTFRSRLMAVTNNVMYPLYGKKQSNPESLKKYYLNVVNYNSIIVYPIMIFMLALGQPFIIQVFGIKWEASIPPLQILSLSVMVHMLVNSNTALVRGMGRPDLEMKLQLIKAVIFVPMLSAGIYFYGITGAAWAILINKVIAVAIAQYTFNKLIHIKMGTMEFLSAIRTPALAGGISYLFVYVIYNFLHLNYILCGVLLFIIYAFLVWLQMGNEIRMQIKSLKLSNKVTY